MNTTRLATVAELQREGALLVEDGNHGEYRPRKHEFTSVGVAFVRAADLNGGRVLFSQTEKISAVAAARITKGIGQPGDVLISHKGTVGKVALAPLDAPPFVCSPQTTFWRTLNEQVLDRRYLYAFVRSSAFHNQLRALGGETDMAPYVSLTSQRTINVTVPSLHIQRAIGRTMAVLDQKIESNARMNETLEAMAQAIFRDWFVDFGPVRRKMEGGTDPVAIMGGVTTDPARAAELAALFPETMGIDELPTSWSIKKLGELTAELRRGLSPKYLDDGGTRVLNQKCIRDRRVSFAPARRHDASQRSIIGRELAPGDILVNSTGVGTLGRVAQIWTLDEATIVDSHVTVVRAAPEKSRRAISALPFACGSRRSRHLEKAARVRPN